MLIHFQKTLLVIFRLGGIDMKILYVSDHTRDDVCGSNISIYKELKRRGIDVEFYLQDGGPRNHYVRGPRLLKKLKSGNFTDMWLANSWATYRGCTLSDINALGVFVVDFGFADPVSFFRYKGTRGNLLASNSLKVVRHVTKNYKKAVFFPASCDLTFHKNLEIDRTTDILIYGCGKHPNLIPREYRIHVVKRILQKFPTKIIKIFGIRWHDVPCLGNLSGDTFIEELNKSKISLDITQAGGQFAHRLFECGACGTPVIARDNEEVTHFFTDSKNILLYTSTNVLMEKIDLALRNPVMLSGIASKFHAICTKNHTIRNRLDMLLPRIKKEK